MQLHQLKPKNKFKKIKRVGRGGKRGTYCGRGQKGQKARSGVDGEPMIRNLLKRYPKLRGYNHNPREKLIAIVSLKEIEAKFNSGEQITPAILVEKKLVKTQKGKIPTVKILSTNDKFSKKLEIINCLLSKKAQEMVESAGGSIK